MPIEACPDDLQLSAYDRGEVSDDLWESVSIHISTCSSCVSRLESLASAWKPAKVNATRLGEGDSFADMEGVAELEAAVDAVLHRGHGTSYPSGQSDPLLPGSVLGEYRIVELIGEGGMGRVFRAEHLRLGRHVALKALRHGGWTTAHALRFEREMKAVGRLSHPNIVRATDAGEINGVHYLAMELIDGETLAQVVKSRGRPKLEEACRWIRQAALALQAAHESGLIHRDVKPGNFMLDRDGQIKVLDLGLARINSVADVAAEAQDEETKTRNAVHPLTWAGGVFGTAAYIAPEQEKDARQVDARADVFGLGGTLWFLLDGKPPPKNVAETSRDEWPGGLPREFWRRFLAVDPEERWPTAAAAAEALAAHSGLPSERRARDWRVPAVALSAAMVLATWFWRPEPASFVHQTNEPTRNPLPRLPFDADGAVALQQEWAAKANAPTNYVDQQGIRFALIPPAEFDLETECHVFITKPYYLSCCEITRGQFAAFVAATGWRTTAEINGNGIYLDMKTMGGHGEDGGGIIAPPRERLDWRTPGHAHATDNHPVCQVSWQDAQRFCEWLSEREGVRCRLPSEAEWTWATRCGETVSRSVSAKTMMDVAWSYYNTRGPQDANPEPHPVGGLKPNAWGLYDMTGNVCEWCEDHSAPPPVGSFVDWRGPAQSMHKNHKETDYRVVLGGQYMTVTFDMRNRGANREGKSTAWTGFRVLREIQTE